MTLPIERSRAVLNTHVFLFELLNKKKVPKWIRKRAYDLLKHYPSKLYIEEAAKRAYSVFGSLHDEAFLDAALEQNKPSTKKKKVTKKK